MTQSVWQFSAKKGPPGHKPGSGVEVPEGRLSDDEPCGSHRTGGWLRGCKDTLQCGEDEEHEGNKKLSFKHSQRMKPETVLMEKLTKTWNLDS